ncbi:M23 family metallopeptidase [Pedobacter immunditicola]|uniref:M23 family metallopeptidase n=1 Tax=Pedobacter immunditicola TaxID=3133440 RepID=UPI003099EFC3
MVKSSTLILLLSCSFFFAKSQPLYSTNKYPLVDFRPPMDIQPPALSGSFGEIRGNHFHSGIDYRTNQREGYPVYAIADGYISRIKVENSGFGLALYLNHPNGFTSVYGHLQRFNPKISQQVAQLQYQKKSFQLDEFPFPTLIPVRKGDLIAYSGNRGSSGGPHLHFEIRDTKTEATVNPQLFGLEIADNIPPVIYSMYVYRLNNQPFNEFTPKQYYQVTGAAGKYRLKTVSTLNIGGEFGLGITVTDKHNGASGTNGVYSIQLEVDGKVVYTSALERFKFENSKGVNSHIDYPAYVTAKQSIQKSFVDPGNPLQIYYNLVNNGRISFTDQAIHDVKYTVTDSKGNESTLQFKVLSDPKAVIPTKEQPAGLLFPYNQLNEFNNGEVKVSIPKGALYNDLNFVYATKPKPASNAFSAIHEIHNKLTPLHTAFDLWIKADSTLTPFIDKALIVNTNRVSQGGAFEKGYIKTKVRNFGSFFIAIDTLAPTIVPLNVSQGKSMKGISKMSFKIRDNLSGLKSFNGYIDGKWVLMEFDAKTATLWHTFDHRTAAGKHTATLVVVDLKNNSKTINIDFYR